MIRTITIIGCLSLPALALGNAGVFEGSGHTVKLTSTADIQLQSEKVKIIAGRGPFLFDGTAPGMDRVEYQCSFRLKNRSRKAVTIQVGFPLTSQFLDSPHKVKNINTADLLFHYKFIARDNDKTYHVRFAPYDRDRKLGSIFLWDMTFEPDEVRELRVAYEIPMGMALNEAVKDARLSESEKRSEWYWAPESAFAEGFDYVTATGQSWSGPIEEATFEVSIGQFERYLHQRRVAERPDSESAKGTKYKVIPQGEWRLKDFLVYRRITPAGWKETDGTLTWKFKDYRPKEPISISYWITGIPRTPEGAKTLVDYALGDNPRADKLETNARACPRIVGYRTCGRIYSPICLERTLVRTEERFKC